MEILAPQAIFSLASVALKTAMSLYANHIPQSGSGVKTFQALLRMKALIATVVPFRVHKAPWFAAPKVGGGIGGDDGVSIPDRTQRTQLPILL
jgi:hypothetical protein